MNISNIGNGVKPYSPQASQNSDAIGEFQRQKEVLTRQLEVVKSKPKNNQAEQNAAEKQIKTLEKQISTIDQKIQKTSQNKSSETAATSQSFEAAQVAENSTQQKSSSMQIDELATASKKIKSPFEATGNIIDTDV